MARKRSNPLLTDTFTRKVKPPETGHIVYFDREIKGYGLRITADDHRAFVFRYRFGPKKHKQQRQYKIGDYPALSAVKARGDCPGLEGPDQKGSGSDSGKG